MYHFYEVDELAFIFSVMLNMPLVVRMQALKLTLNTLLIHFETKKIHPLKFDQTFSNLDV